MVYSRQLVNYVPYSTGLLPGLFGTGQRASAGMRTGSSRTLTTTRTRKNRRKGPPSFRSMMEKNKPTKHYTTAQSVSFTHNTLSTVNVTAGVTQGDLNSSRDGDSISVTGLKMNGQYFSDALAGAYTFRILVGYSGEEYASTTFAGAGLGSSELFLPNTGTTFSTLGCINPRAFTVLHDQKIDLNSQIASVVDVGSFSFYVPLNNARFDYQATGSALGKNKNLYVIVMACAGGGTTGTTATGTLVCAIDLLFK